MSANPASCPTMQWLQMATAMATVGDMMTETLTLTEFLLARIAEDEAVAQGCVREGVTEPGSLLYDHIETPFPEDGAAQDLADSFGPARVLAECEAKRRIVQSCRPIDWRLLKGARPEIVAGYRLIEEQQTLVLSALALPYADHPGYRDEWKP